MNYNSKIKNLAKALDAMGKKKDSEIIYSLLKSYPIRKYGQNFIVTWDSDNGWKGCLTDDYWDVDTWDEKDGLIYHQLKEEYLGFQIRVLEGIDEEEAGVYRYNENEEVWERYRSWDNKFPSYSDFEDYWQDSSACTEITAPYEAEFEEPIGTPIDWGSVEWDTSQEVARFFYSKYIKRTLDELSEQYHNSNSEEMVKTCERIEAVCSENWKSKLESFMSEGTPIETAAVISDATELLKESIQDDPDILTREGAEAAGEMFVYLQEAGFVTIDSYGNAIYNSSPEAIVGDDNNRWRDEGDVENLIPSADDLIRTAVEAGNRDAAREALRFKMQTAISEGENPDLIMSDESLEDMLDVMFNPQSPVKDLTNEVIDGIIKSSMIKDRGYRKNKIISLAHGYHPGEDNYGNDHFTDGFLDLWKPEWAENFSVKNDSAYGSEPYAANWSQGYGDLTMDGFAPSGTGYYYDDNGFKRPNFNPSGPTHNHIAEINNAYTTLRQRHHSSYESIYDRQQRDMLQGRALTPFSRPSAATIGVASAIPSGIGGLLGASDGNEIHVGLDVLGFVGDLFYGQGFWFDGANAALYISKKMYFYAAISILCAFPIFGDILKLFKYGFRGGLATLAFTMKRIGIDIILAKLKEAIRYASSSIKRAGSYMIDSINNFMTTYAKVAGKEGAEEALEAVTKSSGRAAKGMIEEVVEEVGEESAERAARRAARREAAEEAAEEATEQATRNSNRTRRSGLDTLRASRFYKSVADYLDPSKVYDDFLKWESNTARIWRESGEAGLTGPKRGFDFLWKAGPGGSLKAAKNFVAKRGGGKMAKLQLVMLGFNAFGMYMSLKMMNDAHNRIKALYNNIDKFGVPDALSNLGINSIEDIVMKPDEMTQIIAQFSSGCPGTANIEFPHLDTLREGFMLSFVRGVRDITVGRIDQQFTPSGNDIDGTPFGEWSPANIDKAKSDLKRYVEAQSESIADSAHEQGLGAALEDIGNVLNNMETSCDMQKLASAQVLSKFSSVLSENQIRYHYGSTMLYLDTFGFATFLRSYQNLPFLVGLGASALEIKANSEIMLAEAGSSSGMFRNWSLVEAYICNISRYTRFWFENFQSNPFYGILDDENIIDQDIIRAMEESDISIDELFPDGNPTVHTPGSPSGMDTFKISEEQIEERSKSGDFNLNEPG